MIRNYVGLALVLSSVSVWAVGCSSDDDANTDSTTVPDGGSDGSLPDAQPGDDKDAGGDATTGTTCPDTSNVPQRILLTGGYTNGEVAAFNLQTKQVDGRYSFTGGGATSSAFGPYALEQYASVVTKLDPNEPWKAVASWNVLGTDAVDGGQAYSDPSAVVAPACGKGYVVRYNRNGIAVIDTTKSGDAGASASYIDLSSLLHASDHDGSVDATAAVYVPSKNRLYVLLGNTDLTKIKMVGSIPYLLCNESKSTIIAIDTTTDKVVSLGGTGPGGGIELPGYNAPINANALVYDAASDRLLVLQAGCNADAAGDAVGDLEKREIDSVDLKTGTASVALDLNDQGFPGTFVFVDGKRAALGFYGPTYLWDPSTSALGPQVPGNFDVVTHDGKGNLVAVSAVRDLDYNQTGVDIYSVPFASVAAIDEASIVKLGSDPFTDNAGTAPVFAEVWPRP